MTETVEMKTLPVNSRRRLVVVRITAGILASGALLSGSAQAHHSFAGFDQSRKVTVQGTVKDWQFTNPHSWLQLIVTENGEQVEYSIEGASVSTLVRRGWSRNTFKRGEKVTVVMHPLSTGGKGGAFLSATLEDGRTISSGITPN